MHVRYVVPQSQLTPPTRHEECVAIEVYASNGPNKTEPVGGLARDVSILPHRACLDVVWRAAESYLRRV